MPTTIKTKYAYDLHDHPGIHFSPKTKPADKSLTNQADMDAADINKIMARFEQTGVLIDPLGVERKPMYGDFTEIKDYHTSLSAIRNVERAFGLLPAKIRGRFDNDPQKLIDFLENPANDKEAVSLGLKPYEVLLTALADDGVTPITQEEKDSRDAAKAANPPAPAPPAPAPPPAG